MCNSQFCLVYSAELKSCVHTLKWVVYAWILFINHFINYSTKMYKVSVLDPCQLSYTQPSPSQGGLCISHLTNMMDVTCLVTRSNDHIVLPSCDPWQHCHLTGM